MHRPPDFEVILPDGYRMDVYVETALGVPLFDPGVMTNMQRVERTLLFDPDGQHVGDVEDVEWKETIDVSGSEIRKVGPDNQFEELKVRLKDGRLFRWDVAEWKRNIRKMTCY